MRFSLRALLLTVTAIAMLLAVLYGYRRARMCQLKWIAPESTAAKALFPTAEVKQRDNDTYRFVYYACHRDMQSLVHILMKSTTETGSFKVDGQTVVVSTDDKVTALAQLEALRAADTLKPGVFVIRGRVTDRNAKPLALATVDLMGPFVFINHFRTRVDGTFTMPLDDGGMRAPAGGGYYLCVRAQEETAEKLVRWNSPKFALEPQSPERVVSIVVPR